MKQAGSFTEVVKICVNLKTQGAGLWSAMVLFAVASLADAIKAAPSEDPQGKTLKEGFRDREAEVKKEKDGLVLNSIGAYRSAKSVISAAARYNVPLLGEKGVVRGKTEVEEAIAQLREKSTPLTTIARSATTIENKLKEVDSKQDIAGAFALINGIREACIRKAATLMDVSADKAEAAIAKALEKKAA